MNGNEASLTGNSGNGVFEVQTLHRAPFLPPTEFLVRAAEFPV